MSTFCLKTCSDNRDSFKHHEVSWRYSIFSAESIDKENTSCYLVKKWGYLYSEVIFTTRMAFLSPLTPQYITIKLDGSAHTFSQYAGLSAAYLLSCLCSNC